MKNYRKSVAVLLLSLTLTGCDIFDESSYSNSTSIIDFSNFSEIIKSCESGYSVNDENQDLFIEQVNSKNDSYVILRQKDTHQFGFSEIVFSDFYVFCTCHNLHNGKSYSETHQFEWSKDENGEYIREATFACPYGGLNKPMTYSISGTASVNQSLYVDQTETLCSLVNFTTYDAYYTGGFNYQGSNVEIKDETFILPEKMGDYDIQYFGKFAFDIFGFENVKTIIVPSNYKLFYWSNDWNSIKNVERIFIEVTQNECVCQGFYGEHKLFYYSETEPAEYKNLYWRYVDGVPTPWDE